MSQMVNGNNSTTLTEGSVNTNSTSAQIAENVFVQDVIVDSSMTKYQRSQKNPMPDQTPHALLGRRRQVVSSTLLKPLWPNCNIDYILPFQLLSQQPINAAVMSQFRGMRFDMRLTVQISAPPGYYGLVSAHWAYGATVSVTETNWFGRSDLFTQETYLMDVSASEAIEIVIPYISPFDYIDITNANDIQNYGTLTMCLHSLDAVSTVPTSIPYVIQAAFENVDLIVPNPQSPAAVSEVHSESVMKAGGVMLVAGLTALGIQTAGQVEEVFATVSGGVDIAREIASRTDSIKINLNSDHNGKALTPVRQNVLGSVSSVLSPSPFDTLDIVPPITRALAPNFGEHVDSLSGMSKLPGWKGHGRTISTTAPGEWKTIPIYGATRLSFPEGYDTQQYSYFTYYAQFFRFYRATHKVRLHFYTSSLVAAVVKIRIHYTQAGGQEGSISYLSDEVPNVTMMIRGHTVKTLSIPYMNTRPYYATEDLVAVVSLEVVSAPQTFDGNDTFLYYIATHSAEDVSFYSLRNMPTSISSLKEEEAISEVHTSLRLAHQMNDIVDFGFDTTNTPNRDFMPPIRNIRTVLARYSDKRGSAALLKINGMNDLQGVGGLGPFSLQGFTLLEQFTMPFYLRSGSLEIKNVYNASESELEIYLNSTSLAAEPAMGNGFVYTRQGIWSQIEYIVPFISDCGCTFSDVPNIADSLPRVIESSGTGTIGANIDIQVVRAGTDFMWFQPNRLPPTSFWN